MRKMNQSEMSYEEARSLYLVWGRKVAVDGIDEHALAIGNVVGPVDGEPFLPNQGLSERTEEGGGWDLCNVNRYLVTVYDDGHIHWDRDKDEQSHEDWVKIQCEL